jgi:hypothetical protein
MTTQQMENAWDVIREARGLGIELVIDAEAGRLFYRPAGTMSLDLFRRLRQHKAAVLVMLRALSTEIPQDGAPRLDERCCYCGACRWMMPIAWQCGKCHGLWRPSPAPVKVRQAEPEPTGTGT